MLEKALFLISILVLVAPSYLKPTSDQSLDEEFLVPNVPSTLKGSKYGSSKLVFLWENRLFRENRTRGHLREDDPQRPVPETIIAPGEIHMISLVPQDAPHPLYVDKFSNLTDQFILDSMSSETLVPEDPKLTSPEGVTIKTRTGKDLVFKKDSKTGANTVNGLTILEVQKLLGPSPLTVVIIDGLLFDYRKDIGDAFQLLSRDSKPFTRF